MSQRAQQRNRGNRRGPPPNFRFVTKDEAEKIRQANAKAALLVEERKTNDPKTTTSSQSNRNKTKVTRKQQQSTSSKQTKQQRNQSKRNTSNKRQSRQRFKNSNRQRRNQQWKRKDATVNPAADIPASVLFSDLTHRSSQPSVQEKSVEEIPAADVKEFNDSKFWVETMNFDDLSDPE